MTDETYTAAIDRHYEQHWGPASLIRWTSGPVSELPREFGVLRLNRAPDMTAFATRCMSQPRDQDRLELHAFCRRDEADRCAFVEILTAVAHYHRTGAAIGAGHSINLGKPWIPGSSCTFGIVSLPYLDGPSLEWMSEPSVRLLWLIPVTQAEVEFKKAFGLEALEERLQAAEFDYLDPFRASVV